MDVLFGVAVGDCGRIVKAQSRVEISFKVPVTSHLRRAATSTIRSASTRYRSDDADRLLTADALSVKRIGVILWQKFKLISSESSIEIVVGIDRVVSVHISVIIFQPVSFEERCGSGGLSVC